MTLVSYTKKLKTYPIEIMGFIILICYLENPYLILAIPFLVITVLILKFFGLSFLMKKILRFIKYTFINLINNKNIVLKKKYEDGTTEFTIEIRQLDKVFIYIVRKYGSKRTTYKKFLSEKNNNVLLETWEDTYSPFIDTNNIEGFKQYIYQRERMLKQSK